MADKAKPCFQEFITKVHTAVGDLYSLEFNHGNLRLANICYNKIFEPVLIDLDGASPVVYDSYYNEDIQTSANKILIHFEKLRHMKASWTRWWLLNLMVNKGVCKEKLLKDDFAL